MPAIDPFATELKNLPDVLRLSVTHLKQRWEALPEAALMDWTRHAPIRDSLVHVWASSLFVAETCIRQPTLLIDLAESGDLSRRYLPGQYAERLTAASFADETDLMRQLRHIRRREMVRIAWRDLAGWASLDETLLDLSNLADACIETALAFLYQEACTKYGTPLLANGSRQQMVVLGMGKLGAHELNYSSDIDLIFAYPEDGVLPNRKSTSYGEFFTKLCQSLVKVLDTVTLDGFVFRTDIRLRPFGDSGALIMTFAGMEHYYLTQAREWERYAMIKARQVAGDFTVGAELLALLNAFVYRRYLDYGAFEELRALKAQISQELRRKDRLDNIKLGVGGIREIEFIGQAFQLIRGGAVKSLQIRGILAVLQKLGELGLLPVQDAQQLSDNYRFLRCVENRIQQYQDRQTHDLPSNPQAQQSLAYTLGFADWSGFKQALDTVRAAVHAVFESVFSLSKQDLGAASGGQIWCATAPDRVVCEELASLGFIEPEAALAAIRQFQQTAAIRRLSNKGTAVLARLMPSVLLALKENANPDVTLKRVLNLFEAIAGRTVYWSLLAENPHALAQLLRLASASPWLSGHLARHPILFDELLDPRSLLNPLKKEDLEQQLAILLAGVGASDLEQLMIVLREFKQQHVLKVAAADLMGAIPLMVVSDYLTCIAESILAQVIDRAWRILVDKHGTPPACDNQASGFALVGFGKLGGFELGYGSDLDLVFICDYADAMALTNGGKPIPCSQFYGRLGQKVRHILDTKLLSGVLYEVDMRLRPSGDSGLLVTHIGMYEDYLRHQAWTWEHQALVRSRFIAGDSRLKSRYETIRHTVLSLPRTIDTLKTEVREMREKMRENLADKTAGKFDLKQSEGGIADIEFIVQFLVLAHAADFPDLTQCTDKIRLLERLSRHGLVPDASAETLKNAYCLYRDLGHKRALQGEAAVVDETEVTAVSAKVTRIWRALLTQEDTGENVEIKPQTAVK